MDAYRAHKLRHLAEVATALGDSATVAVVERVCREEGLGLRTATVAGLGCTGCTARRLRRQVFGGG